MDRPEPLGFPNCKLCYYRDQGTADMCGSCAAQTFDVVGPDSCPICSQRLLPDAMCSNILCRANDRSFDRIYAIAMASGALRNVIVQLKQRGARESGYGWAIILGRIVIAWLDAEQLVPDIIVANPTYMTNGKLGHTELVLEAAQREDLFDEWNIVPVGLEKISTTRHPRTTYPDKMAAADELLDAVEIHFNPTGCHVLIFGDIATTGLQLDRLAQLLKSRGATRVDGLVMARTPWRT